MKKPRKPPSAKKPRPPAKVTAKAPPHPVRVTAHGGGAGAAPSRRKGKVKLASRKPLLVSPKSKRRQFSPGLDVACCSAEALATLLWLSGRPVSYEDVLALYWRTASDPDSGASILATLQAASGSLPIRISSGEAFPYGVADACVRESEPNSPGLVLGVTLPEPHAVAVTPDGTWHSWGEPFDPGDWPELVIEEAWAVGL